MTHFTKSLRHAGYLAFALMSLSLTACGASKGERALSGGAIGAGVGAAGAAVAGGNALGGAVLGGAVGAATGALTRQDQIDLDR